ncbi:MAG: M28 family peptidase [Ktedonobacterales bacterium]
MRRMIMIAAMAGMLLAAGLPAPFARSGATTATTRTAVQRAAADQPAVAPGYIYDQLAYMATTFQRREAGYDANLPVTVNGHDEFADYWQREMLANLSGFGAVARRDPFPIAGWQGQPATVPAFNVEVTVPGQTQPEQMVVIGCHYDGMANSTQSANDDGSGCAIELGIARAMATFWRTHHVVPARTLRFVIFDAEEQGLYGSFHYLDATVNGDIANIVAMFNEEQNGIAYPVRFLGDTRYPVLPYFDYLSPLASNDLYPNREQLSPAQRDALARFRADMALAVPDAFAGFQQLGYSSLGDTNSVGKTVPRPVFGASDVSQVQLADDTIGSSDQMPFTLAGVPAAMLVGNSSYYDPNAPPWSYPYDQPQDTVALMNTYASGSATEAKALELALALPGMLTTWMLARQDVLGMVAPDGKPVAAISDVGPTVAGQSMPLDALAAYTPGGSGTLGFAWQFGDGASASGVRVQHTYAHPGTYTLALTVTGSGGTRTERKTLTVTSSATKYPNPYAGYHPNGLPPPNPQVVLPVPRVSAAPAATPTPQPAGSGSGVSLGAVVVYLLLGALALVLLAGHGLLQTRRRKG